MRLEVNDENKPWTNTPSTRPHIADFLAYVLDKPNTERVPTHLRAPLHAKHLHSASALGVLSQVAYALDAFARHLTRPMDGRTFSKGRQLNIS